MQNIRRFDCQNDVLYRMNVWAGLSRLSLYVFCNEGRVKMCRFIIHFLNSNKYNLYKCEGRALKESSCTTFAGRGIKGLHLIVSKTDTGCPSAKRSKQVGKTVTRPSTLNSPK